jgi:hypothetical protein
MGLPQQVKKRFQRFSDAWHFRPRAAATMTGIPLLFTLLFAPLENAIAAPSAQEVLRLARASETAQNIDFAGKLTTSSNRRKVAVPFRLSMRGPTITYQFVDAPPEALILRMGEKGSRLERAIGSGRTKTVSGDKLDDLVRGTDITYEDLALGFLYWNNAKIVGEQTLKTRKCWIVQATPPNPGASQYDTVRLWIEKTGGLLRAECFVRGKLAKRFEVSSVQKAPGGGYVLKTLNIQRMDAGGKDHYPTRLVLTPL